MYAVSPVVGCFALVVGKEASTDGSVLMAHNEDDGGQQLVNHHHVPRQKFTPAEKRMLEKVVMGQNEYAWAHIWSEMPGLDFSDSYLNEWGVCIASDGCKSKEFGGEIVEGGIGKMLRRLVALRAQTSREGVLLAGKLIEHFGYVARGRTYIICDREQGWLFSAVRGKHWLAQRVPDDEVAAVANTYTIHRIDLSDPQNFLGSPDIIEYAKSKGWYDSRKDGPFDFAAAYANPGMANHNFNITRQWGALRRVADKPVPRKLPLPFSVKPKHKLSVADVADILRDHYKGVNPVYSPTEQPLSRIHAEGICNRITQTSFVAQLRRDMPREIGIVYWLSLAKPCRSFFIPFHFGAGEFPQGYGSPYKSALMYFNQKKKDAPFIPDWRMAFWSFTRFYEEIEPDRLALLYAEIEKVESRAFFLQKPVEKTALQLLNTEKSAARDLLANYSRGIYLEALEAMNKTILKSSCCTKCPEK